MTAKAKTPAPKCKLCGKKHTTQAHEPDPDTFYEWTVKFRVNATWVADGFNLDDDRARSMLEGDLDYAYGWELDAKVVKAPDPQHIAWEQGYDRADETKKRKKKGT